MRWLRRKIVLESSEPGKLERAAGIVKGLSLSNVLVIALLAVIAIPVYVIYKALGDEKIMNRLLSRYEELDARKTGCTLRHVQERGGPDLWGVSAGFSFIGTDRWFVNVVMDHNPSDEEVVSYCEALKLIADRMLDRGDGYSDTGRDTEIQRGPMPGTETDRR